MIRKCQGRKIQEEQTSALNISNILTNSLLDQKRSAVRSDWKSCWRAWWKSAHETKRMKSILQRPVDGAQSWCWKWLRKMSEEPDGSQHVRWREWKDVAKTCCRHTSSILMRECWKILNSVHKLNDWRKLLLMRSVKELDVGGENDEKTYDQSVSLSWISRRQNASWMLVKRMLQKSVVNQYTKPCRVSINPKSDSKALLSAKECPQTLYQLEKVQNPSISQRVPNSTIISKSTLANAKQLRYKKGPNRNDRKRPLIYFFGDCFVSIQFFCDYFKKFSRCQ